MKKRFTEAQIIGFLREGGSGVAITDLCRRHGFSEASYYLWRGKFGGMSVSDAKRLKELETENGRLSERRVLTVVRMSATPCGAFRPRIAMGRFGRRSRYWRTATGGTGPG